MIRICNAAENTLVIHLFSRTNAGKDFGKNLRAIIIKNVSGIGNTPQIKSIKLINKYCNEWPWIREDNTTSVIILIGHNGTFSYMCYTKEFHKEIQKAGIKFIKHPIRSNENFIAYWLQDAHAKLMDFYEYNVSLQEHLLIKKSNLDVKIVPITHKNHPDEIYDNNKSFTVAAINIANTDIAQKLAKGILRAIFKLQTIEAAID